MNEVWIGVIEAFGPIALFLLMFGAGLKMFRRVTGRG